MSNVNTVSSYTSSTGLTTAKVTEYYTANNVPSFDAVKAVCEFKMAAETGLVTAGGAVATMSIPLFSVATVNFIPTRCLVELLGVGSFPAGTDKATASLSFQLATAATPTTLAFGGTVVTPAITTTLINAAAANTPLYNTNTLITAASTVGTSVPTTVGQHYTTQIVNTSTNKSVVVPGKTCYLNITSGGTVTTNDLTCTGSWRIYVFGNNVIP